MSTDTTDRSDEPVAESGWADAIAEALGVSGPCRRGSVSWRIWRHGCGRLPHAALNILLDAGWAVGGWQLLPPPPGVEVVAYLWHPQLGHLGHTMHGAALDDVPRRRRRYIHGIEIKIEAEHWMPSQPGEHLDMRVDYVKPAPGAQDWITVGGSRFGKLEDETLRWREVRVRSDALPPDLRPGNSL